MCALYLMLLPGDYQGSICAGLVGVVSISLSLWHMTMCFALVIPGLYNLLKYDLVKCTFVRLSIPER